MARFVGRQRQLGSLARELGRVVVAVPEPGRCVLIRGRRRVGKSRLVEEFIARAEVPAVFYTASRQGGAHERELFAEEVAASRLPGADLFRDVQLDTWEALFRLLAQALPQDGRAIVVIDELPYLMEGGGSFDAVLQKCWDRFLKKLPVLLLLVGSDLAMMEQLNAYGRPFYQRGSELVVPPFDPAETAEMLGLEAADAIDAHLVTGGLPLVVDEWERGSSLFEYIERALAEPTSALIVSGERALAAEFPVDVQARRVLTAIGAGERTFSNIREAAGGLQPMSLNRSLDVLADKRVVAVDRPVSTKPSRETRYRVADSYLQFWLRFIGPSMPEIERGRWSLVVERIRESWLAWRGKAVEPLVREGVELLLPTDDRLRRARHVGGYWTRTNTPEVDLVGVDKTPVATRLAFVGSIKWKDSEPFDSKDLARLVRDREMVPGADVDTPLVCVSRTGFDVTGVHVSLTPDDLVKAWRRLHDGA